MDREKYYDETVMAKVREVVDICHERDMAVICAVSFDDGKVGVTASGKLEVVHELALLVFQHGPNLDGLIHDIMDYAANHADCCLSDSTVAQAAKKARDEAVGQTQIH